jgi:hypothetical protein
MTLMTGYLGLDGIARVWSVFFYHGWTGLMKVVCQMLMDLRPVIDGKSLEEISIHIKEHPKALDLAIDDLMQRAKGLRTITPEFLAATQREFYIKLAKLQVDGEGHTSKMSEQECDAVLSVRTQLETEEDTVKTDIVVFQGKIERVEKELHE